MSEPAAENVFLAALDRLTPTDQSRRDRAPEVLCAAQRRHPASLRLNSELAESAV